VGLYAAVLAAVVAFRIVLPHIRSRRHALDIRDVVAESPDVVSVVLEGSAAFAVASLIAICVLT
jgi:hypothetical protein